MNGAYLGKDFLLLELAQLRDSALEVETGLLCDVGHVGRERIAETRLGVLG